MRIIKYMTDEKLHTESILYPEVGGQMRLRGGGHGQDKCVWNNMLMS